MHWFEASKVYQFDIRLSTKSKCILIHTSIGATYLWIIYIELLNKKCKITTTFKTLFSEAVLLFITKLKTFFDSFIN